MAIRTASSAAAIDGIGDALSAATVIGALFVAIRPGRAAIARALAIGVLAMAAFNMAERQGLI